MIQRDYIDRLIEQCAEALRRMLRLRQAGQHDVALHEVEEATERLLGPLRPVLERLEATSAVAMAGPNERDRVRMYAALVGEQGLIHKARGDSLRAYLSSRRALELLAAVHLAGTRLSGEDLGRIAVLSRIVDVGELDERYGAALRGMPPGSGTSA